MNTDTGQIYRGEDEINAALERGEPVVPVSEKVARIVEAGQRAIAAEGEVEKAEGEVEKTGALLIAEIDRLLQLKEQERR